MIFETVGNKEKPVILMLNGSFSTGAGLLHIAEMISDEFHIILPTYDGHFCPVYVGCIDRKRE